MGSLFRLDHAINLKLKYIFEYFRLVGKVFVIEWKMRSKNNHKDF